MAVYSRLDICKKEKEYHDNISTFRESCAKFLTSCYKLIFRPGENGVAKIIELITNARPNKILDVGAGNCDICLEIINKTDVTRYVRSDISAKNLYKIEGSNITNVVFNGLKHSIRANAFDVVFSKCVIHHIDNGTQESRRRDRIDFLKEQMRLVKKNGKIFCMDIYDPTRNGLRGWLWHIIKYRWILGEERHNHLLTEEIVQLFRDAGIRKIKKEEIDTYKGKYFIVWGEK